MFTSLFFFYTHEICVAIRGIFHWLEMQRFFGWYQPKGKKTHEENSVLLTIHMRITGIRHFSTSKNMELHVTLPVGKCKIRILAPATTICRALMEKSSRTSETHKFTLVIHQPEPDRKNTAHSQMCGAKKSNFYERLGSIHVNVNGRKNTVCTQKNWSVNILKQWLFQM